jgi:hypothetical protein
VEKQDQNGNTNQNTRIYKSVKLDQSGNLPEGTENEVEYC